MIRIDDSLLTPEVKQILLANSEHFTFQKNEILVEAGKTCNYLFIIEKGMLRSFYYNKKGNDVTNWFSSEQMIITEAYSFFKRKPSNIIIEAIEETSVKAISHEQLEDILSYSKEVERFMRLLVTEIMLTLGKKVIYYQNKSAKERYDDLLKTHPDIFKRAKLGHIAGYLGLTQQSLSRIRSKSE
jgi:CRP-like cAMP-binding protein